MIGHYKRSKFLAEQVALEASSAGAACDGPETRRRQSGAGDSKPTPTGRIVVDFLNRRFPAYVDTGLNLVDVEEVARMHVIAPRPAGGRESGTFWVGKNLSLKQILDRMSAITGLPSPTHKVAACGGD